MHCPTKKLFTGDISSRTDFPMSVLNESWRSSRRRHYNNAFLASLFPGAAGRTIPPGNLLLRQKSPGRFSPGGGRGRLVLVPIDSTNYSQTRRYRGPFSRTLFSQSVDRSATFFTNVDIWFGALGEIKFYDSPGQCLMIPCIHNIYSAVTPINFL